MSDEHTTSRAPHMEKYVQVRDGQVWLIVGNQSFPLAFRDDPEEPDSAEQLVWMRDMLCIALDALVAAETGELKDQLYSYASTIEALRRASMRIPDNYECNCPLPYRGGETHEETCPVVSWQFNPHAMAALKRAE